MKLLFNKRKDSRERILPVYFWALSFLKPYMISFIFLILCGFVITGIQLLIPKFIQYFIDHILPDKNIDLFYLLLSGVVGLLLIMFCGMAVQNLLQRSLQEKAARDLQYSIFKKLRSLGYSYFERHPIGESLSLMNTEVTSVQELYKSHFPHMIRGLIFTFISIGILVSLNAKLTLVIIPSLFLYYLVGPYFERKASILGKQVADLRVLFGQKSYESVSSLNELRVNNSEAWNLKRLLTSYQNVNDRTIKLIWYAFWRGTVRRLSYYVGGMLLIYFGFIMIQNQTMSVGVFVAFLLYYFQAMQRITGVITSITEQKVLIYQARRLFEFIHTNPDVKEPREPKRITVIKGEIHFKDISFQYNDEQPILENFQINIQPGERVALVGPSGSGKSTILKLLGRFYNPREGEILLDGIPIDQLSFSELRESMGFVFQETYLFGESVRENIRFGNPDATDEMIEKAARAAFAHDFIMQLPNGYDTPLGERGVKLSGGQKQRIAIARMFIKDPSIVILDEATSALDNESEQMIKRALSKLFESRTIIAIAHRLSTIKDYDKIVYMDKGQIREIGTYQELIEKKGLFYQLLQSKESENSEFSKIVS